jgi:hypothetical protein
MSLATNDDAAMADMASIMEPTGEEMEAMLGAKQTSGKIPVELIAWPAMLEVARVLEFGAQKYDDWNWSKGVKYMSLIASTIRHCIKFICGENRDDESGLPHTAHAMCNLMFLTHFQQVGRPDLDDRPDTLKAAHLLVSQPDQEKWAKYANVMNLDK